MGIYLNPGNEAFRQIRNTHYVDKSGLIGYIHRTINPQMIKPAKLAEYIGFTENEAKELCLETGQDAVL